MPLSHSKQQGTKDQPGQEFGRHAESEKDRRPTMPPSVKQIEKRDHAESRKEVGNRPVKHVLPQVTRHQKNKHAHTNQESIVVRHPSIKVVDQRQEEKEENHVIQENARFAEESHERIVGDQ